MSNINISNTTMSGNFVIGNNKNNNFNNGDGKVIVKSFNDVINQGDIDTLNSSGAINILLKVDPLLKEKTLTFRGEEHISFLLDIKNENGTLKVGFKPNSSFSTNQPLEIVCSVPSLDNISLNGSGSIKGEYIGTKLKVDVSGSGDIKLFGRAEILETIVVGSGDADLKNFTVQHAKLNVQGSGAIEAYALQTIDAKVVGSGDITGCGTYAQFNKNVSGSGDITSKKGYFPKESNLYLSAIVEALQKQTQVHIKNNDSALNGGLSTTERIEMTKKHLREQNIDFGEDKKETIFQKIKKFF